MANIAPLLRRRRLHRLVLSALVMAMLAGMWVPVPALAEGAWQGEYYNNMWLGGQPALLRNDPEINFSWGAGSPGEGVNADNFSVRWARNATFATSGNYIFSATVDDGVRLWVNGNLIIDKWYQQSTTTHTATLYLNAGVHHVRVEYFDATGAAVCVVSWAAAGTSPAPAPSPAEIVVDNRDPGFVWGGAAGSFYQRNVGYGGHLNWTWNRATQYTHWAKWFPHITSPGNYEVYAYIASRFFGSKSARYQVYHNGQRHDKIVNQNNYYDQWVSLGTYVFSGGPNEYVFMTNATGEGNGTRYVGYDAVKFVRRDGDAPPPPPSDCAIAPVLGFGRIWNGYSQVRAKLGCAQGQERSVWAAEETFVGGYMFWRQDVNKIYALYANGSWQAFDDTWTPADPEWDPALVPPAGAYQPRRGFGKVWRDHSTVRDRLGWATTEERGYHGAVQSFEGGTMLWSNLRGIFILYNDGTWARYN